MARILPLMMVLALVTSTAAAQAPTETLILVIRTGPEKTLADIQETIDSTLKTMALPLKAVARPLSAVEYGVYARLDNPKADPPKLPVLADKLYELRQLESADPTWQVRLLDDPLPVLRTLAIEYQDGTAEEVKVEREGPLRPVLPGTYVYKPTDPAKTPAKFKLATTDTEGGAMKDVSGEWPKGDKFYLIRLAGFPPEQRPQFAATIKNSSPNGGIGGNALDTFEIKSGVTLAVGEGDSSEDGPISLDLDGHKLVINVPALRKGQASRAYLQFPFKKEETAAALGKFANLTAGKTLDAIRATTPLGVDQAAVLTPESGALWLELAPVPGQGRFTRTIYLGAENAANVPPDTFKALLAEFPTAHGLLAYEFDNGAGVRNALPYTRVAGQRQRPVNTFDVPEWESKLKLAADRAK